MNGQNGHGVAGAAAYGLGVDLGTSNTVAVLRWPDGRTRPLLFDGQPVVPSGVYRDPGGQFHVGRDAQRLAQADPARYEPNPKRRVDEPAVLLGDREVSTVDLFAAVLGAVARAAVEAVGFLPPAVLTYPAAWGARRRDVLAAAAARAGWPPVTLVPEPVAAARYFADVLRRPVPVGASIGVFDFGGGTLDIAVVRNEGVDTAGRPRFAVTSSGGVAELGGLDLDSALVDHLGGLLARSGADAWRRINQPRGTGEWRERRRYWEEVRAAKEMLSRSTTAPVAIPGVDQAAHLTRDELERLVAPLLRRGVAEAASVIAASRLHPAQLAGLFLVGGSSRVPLVARLLHAELGIAPTVLEQPEIPVAEGALAELTPPAHAPGAAGAAPVSGGPPVSPAGFAAAPPPVSPPPAPVPPGFAAPPPPRRRLHRRPAAWIVAGAVVALAALAVTWFVVFRDRYPRLDFQAVGSPAPISVGAGYGYSNAWTHVSGDIGYIAWQGGDKRMLVRSINLPAGDKNWETEVPASTDGGWAGIIGLADGVAVVPYRSSSTPVTVTVLRGEGTKDRWTLPLGYYDTLTFYEKTVVHNDRAAKKLVFLNAATGAEIRPVPDPPSQYGGTPAVLVARTPADYAGPAGIDDAPAGNTQAYVPSWGDDNRLVVINADKSMRIFDTTTGVPNTRPNVAKPGDNLLVYDDKLYVAVTQGGYEIVAYDLNAATEPRTLYKAKDGERRLIDFAPCGKDRICALDQVSTDDATTELSAVDTGDGGEIWRAPARGMKRVTQVGDRALVRSAEPRSMLFDPKGNKVMDRAGVAVRVDGGNVLVFAGALTTSASDLSVAGLGVHAAKPVELGLLQDAVGADCSWNSSVILCPSTKDFRIWRFAAD